MSTLRERFQCPGCREFFIAESLEKLCSSCSQGETILPDHSPTAIVAVDRLGIIPKGQGKVIAEVFVYLTSGRKLTARIIHGPYSLFPAFDKRTTEIYGPLVIKHLRGIIMDFYHDFKQKVLDGIKRPLPPAEKEPIDLSTKKCLICSKEFFPKKNTQRFCSRECFSRRKR